MARQQVPVTPAVIEWALEQAGKTRADLAAATKASRTVVDKWFDGACRPNLTQARSIAKVVRRPLAFLMWSEPPRELPPAIPFRSATKQARGLNPSKRRIARKSRRVQRVVDGGLKACPRKRHTAKSSP